MKKYLDIFELVLEAHDTIHEFADTDECIKMANLSTLDILLVQAQTGKFPNEQELRKIVHDTVWDWYR